MKTYKKILIVLNLFILAGYFLYSLSQKESILKDGKLVLLELAPVDPRSLMQGDYMILRYAEARDFSDDLPNRGYIIMKSDENGVGKRIRVQEEIGVLSDSHYAVNYTKDRWRLSIGAESFFFEEGQAEKYDSARYGALKVDQEGHSLLIGLYNEKLEPIN